MSESRVISIMGYHALAIVTQFGWPVLRLRPAGKLPSTAHGLLDATSSPERVCELWDEMPDANIGIATGAASGVIVVDVDGLPGEAVLARMGEIPVTPTSITAKGRHLLFRRDDLAIRNSARKLGPDLDVRGDGGYIVAPPSRHESGHTYQWAPGRSPWEVEPAPLPAALRQRLEALSRPPVPAAVRRPPHPLPMTDERLRYRALRYLVRMGNRTEGSRNDAAHQAAKFLQNDLQLPVETALALIAEWNEFNSPPLPADELEEVVRRAPKYARRPAGYALQEAIG